MSVYTHTHPHKITVHARGHTCMQGSGAGKRRAALEEARAPSQRLTPASEHCTYVLREFNPHKTCCLLHGRRRPRKAEGALGKDACMAAQSRPSQAVTKNKESTEVAVITVYICTNLFGDKWQRLLPFTRRVSHKHACSLQCCHRMHCAPSTEKRWNRRSLTLSSCDMHPLWTRILQAAHFFRVPTFCKIKRKSKESEHLQRHLRHGTAFIPPTPSLPARIPRSPKDAFNRSRSGLVRLLFDLILFNAIHFAAAAWQYTPRSISP
jgi:hypothetical protein